jgi:hypothetical protein
VADAAERLAPSRWNNSLAGALIAAAAAVAGAAVGGFATYFGSYELQKSEMHSAAQGAARVLQGDFAGAAARIEVELTQHRYLAPPAGPVITIDTEDEKQIAANVSANTWDRIVSARLVIRDEQESASNVNNPEVIEARYHLPVILKGARLRFEERSYRAIDEAAVALREITGT